mmetsp:Transcript_32469/g.38225  ORF Transcript_32469/g.38225 Transcript_32469/m.38225 type:complete len:203 (-) Transcript_32469:90-698(-)
MRFYSATALHNRFIVVAGGVMFKNETDKVFKFDIDSNEWSTGPNLPEPRREHSSCSIRDTIYLFGGYGPKFKKYYCNFLTWIKLDKSGEPAASSPHWTNYECPQVVPRCSVLMAPIGPHSILIFGGRGPQTFDNLIFNVKDLEGDLTPIEVKKTYLDNNCRENTYCYDRWGDIIMVACNGARRCLMKVSNQGKSLKIVKSLG